METDGETEGSEGSLALATAAPPTRAGGGEAVLKESPFFSFLNRRGGGIDQFLRESTLDEDYIDWNQFVLPRDYGDAELEYRSIREGCALFDASPIRKYQIRGSGASDLLDHLLTRPVSQAPSMRGIYVAYCNLDGSLKDDSILYKYAEDDYLLMPSDIDHQAYIESLRTRLGIDDVSIVECTHSLIGVSLQGPLSATVLRRWGFDGIEKLRPFDVRDYSLAGGSIRISRMGFTADLGYECWLDPQLRGAFEEGIQRVSKQMGIEIPGYGLAALEACRLEGRFIVPGWDCSTEADPNPDLKRSPYELGIGWLVKLDDREFVGRDALAAQEQEGPRFCLRSFEMEDARKPEGGTELYASVEGRDVAIGLIPCSSWSWGLERMIGNASVERRYAKVEQAWIEVDGERLRVQLSRGPLVSFERNKQVPAPIDERFS